jgi:hypothetical protein
MNDLRYDMEIQAFANEGFMVYEGIEPCEFKVEHIMLMAKRSFFLMK